MAQSYLVFKVRTGPVLPDPDMPFGPRYHTTLFIQTDPIGGSGVVHHVTEDLVAGMRYENEGRSAPEEWEGYHSKEPIGSIERVKVADVERICKTLPAPPKQKAFNIKTMRTEPIKPDGTFYEAGQERVPLVKCTEWIERRAIPALREAEILREECLGS